MVPLCQMLHLALHDMMSPTQILTFYKIRKRLLLFKYLKLLGYF